MEQDTSYNKIKRATNEELAEMWARYFDDHDNKELRDALILQYIYQLNPSIFFLIILVYFLP